MIISYPPAPLGHTAVRLKAIKHQVPKSPNLRVLKSPSLQVSKFAIHKFLYYMFSLTFFSFPIEGTELTGLH